MNAIVGDTGFVGSNLFKTRAFEMGYNSKNISNSYGLKPDLLIYAGVKGEKFLANGSPEEDMQAIFQAQENIKKINPVKLVLISTIDVFKKPVQVDERTKIDTEGLEAYGLNRYRLECWVRENYPDALIVRLPGLIGTGIKKNFIYDYIHRIPSLLKKEKYEELKLKDDAIEKYYSLQKNGFFKCKILNKEEAEFLKTVFLNINFSALNFTDSRSKFQFYSLDRLWDDVQIALNEKILLLHMATEPISACELYEKLAGEKFINELKAKPAEYNYKTIYDDLFNGGRRGYIYEKEESLRLVQEFIENYANRG